MEDPYPPFGELHKLIKGEILTDLKSRTLYATDASVYSELPLAVVQPRDVTDVSMIVRFAAKHGIALIPRGAGTSLAGQVVGNGLVVDVSHYMNHIIEINAREAWALVEPGVVLDDLNREVANHQLFFGPETSTSNRCTLGGMVANNSCGSHSLIYGSTRDHIIEITGFLSSGEEVTFKPMQKWEFDKMCREEGHEGDIYRLMREIYTDVPVRKQIRKEFPHPDIKRRNSGYAIDVLLDTLPFKPEGEPFNLAKLIAGSEGTLLFITSVKLALVPIPKPVKVLLCAHFSSLHESLKANLIALNHAPDAIELMDKNILDLTLDNPLQRTNRYFVEGDPAALLLIEFSADDADEALQKARRLADAFKNSQLGYAFPVVEGKEISKVWALRKAGLGVLSNMKGDAKPVSLIEDTAVRPADLPEYVDAINEMLAKYGKTCVYHAHVGTGELHIRPVLNLKDAADVQLFRTIAEDTAVIVKRFNGSLSGEHGDGRLRGEFIPLMVGEANFELMKRVKKVFDPNSIFNTGKITDTPPMDKSFRYLNVDKEVFSRTFFNWDDQEGLFRATERCSGSGDCLKSSLSGGTMCPSYMGTREELHSTRGRANLLRSFLQNHADFKSLSLTDVVEALDLCLSCKACKSECPSGVDMARLKAEFLQHVHDKQGVDFKTRIIANLPRVNRFLSPFAVFYNRFSRAGWVKQLLLKYGGISTERNLPLFSKIRFDKWFHKKGGVIDEHPNGAIMLLADEFTNFYDSEIGVKTVGLLHKLGYGVVLAPVKETGRTQISKGFLRSAKNIANHNIRQLKEKVTDNMPLVGMEPSAILTFRDEYPVLVSRKLIKAATDIAKYTFTLEEFLDREMQNGKIRKESFTGETKEIRFHAHCHQKSLSNTKIIERVLSFPENYTAIEIPSGCCGMAGSFGYEEKHYHLSMKIGELSLFPAIRKTSETTLLVATGHSCRHQIKDGTHKEAQHTAEVLFEALV